MAKPKITKVITFCAAAQGCQACAPTEKKALKLLEETIANKKAAQEGLTG